MSGRIFFAITLSLHIKCTLQQQCDPCAGSDSNYIFKVKPGTGCVEYVQCIGGQKMGDFRCSGDTIYDEEKQYCNWVSNVNCVDTGCDTLSPTEQPSTQPTKQPSASPVVSTAITIEMPEPAVVDILVGDGSSDDCSNSCLLNYTGLQAKPGANCKKIVECDNGQVISEMECPGELFFIEESGVCENTAINKDLSNWTCPEVPCQSIPDPPIQPTLTPTTPKPTPMPVSLSTYQDFRTYLTDREDMLKEIVFKQSNGYPSTAYTYPDLITALDIATLQLPADKAFFNGEGLEGRLPKLSGMEYGYVNHYIVCNCIDYMMI